MSCAIFAWAARNFPPSDKARFKQLSERLAELSSKFNDNLLDATNAFELIVQDSAQLSGIPEDVLEAAHRAAAEIGKAGWKFTLQMPSYSPGHAVRGRPRVARTAVSRLRHPRCRVRQSGMGQHRAHHRYPEVAARAGAIARLQDISPNCRWSRKWPIRPSRCSDFSRNWPCAPNPTPSATWRELKEFAARQLGLAELQPWDVAYASEKLRVARYAFSDQEVKQYFPEQQVLAGMFRVVETLYGLSIAAR